MQTKESTSVFVIGFTFLIAALLLWVTDASGQSCSFEQVDNKESISCESMNVSVLQQPSYRIETATIGVMVMEGEGAIFVLTVASDRWQFSDVNEGYAEIDGDGYRLDLQSLDQEVVKGRKVEQKIWRADGDAFSEVRRADTFAARINGAIFDLGAAILQAREIERVLERRR